MDVLVKAKSLLLEQNFWIAKVHHYKYFCCVWMIFFHMNYMKKRLRLFYSGDIIDIHHIFCVDYTTSAIFHNINLCP